MNEIEKHNAQVWDALKAHGASEKTPLVLDFFWYAKDTVAAAALTLHLRKGIAQTVDTKVAGDEWSISAQTKPQCFTLDDIQKLDREMRALGEKFNCEFDGWGAEAPAPAKEKKPWWKFW